MPAPGQVNAGERVRITRAEQGLSQAQLAARAGVDPSTVSALETGRRWPRAEQQVRIEKALGWKPGTLERTARDYRPGQVPPDEPPPLPPMSADERRAVLAYLEIRRASERTA